MNYEQQEEVQAREWEKALVLIENLFKDCKENGSPNKVTPKEEPLAMDVARWKVVWGKKPAQYRLKPFLTWSVDEMPSIPEEGEPFPGAVKRIESTDKVKVEYDPIKIRNDKQMKIIRRKMFKLNRRMDEITVLLVHASEGPQGNETESNSIPGNFLTESSKVELISERNMIWEKLRKNRKKLIALKTMNDYKKNQVETGQDDTRVVVDAASGNSTSLVAFANQDVDEEALSFKHGRRLAIKKDGKTFISSKAVNSSVKDNVSRKSEPLDPVEEKKSKKKKICRKHHRRPQMEIPSSENELLSRRTLSEGDISRIKGAVERVLQKHDGIEGGDRERLGKQVEVRIHRNCPVPKRNSSIETYSAIGEARNGVQKSANQWSQTEAIGGCSKSVRPKKREEDRLNTIRIENEISSSSQLLAHGNVCKNSSRVKKESSKVCRVGVDSDVNGDESERKVSTDQNKLVRSKKGKDVKPRVGYRKSKQDSKEIQAKINLLKDSESSPKMES